MKRTFPTTTTGVLAASSLLMLAACANGENGTTAAGAPEDTKASLEDPTSTSPEEAWITPALIIDCDDPEVDPAGCTGPGEEAEFASLTADDVEEPWHFCATVPHVSDPIWVAYNYAAATEAERLGVSLEYHDAGGYEGVVEQVEQVENCISGGADAIIVGAVSTDAINPSLENAIANDIVVIDVGNGVSSEAIPGRAIVDYYQMGYAAGEQVLLSEDVETVALLPGPAGAGWVERTVDGFESAIEDSGVELVDIQYGDTAQEVQLSLTEDVLSAEPDLDAVVGTAVTMDVAHIVLAERGLQDEVSLFGTYLNPETLELIEAGRVECAPTEQPVITMRMGLNLGISLLQDEYPVKGYERYSPLPLTVCSEANEAAEAVEDFAAGTSFAPSDWSVTSSVDADSE